MAQTSPSVTSRVVVGIDGSEGSARALRFAHEEARLRGARLDVVLAWGLLSQPGVPEGGRIDPGFDTADAQAFVERFVGEVLGAEPGVDVHPVPVCDLPAAALLDQAAGADLVVVGARGLGGFRGLLLGSVSQQVVQHAPCPVAVVPDSQD